MRRVFCIAVASIVLLFGTIDAHALTIKPNFESAFSDDEKKVIDEAVREWAVLLPCNDKMSIDIDFYCNNSLSDLGATWIDSWSGTNPGEGRPTKATIEINNISHTWTLDRTINNTDAAETLKHEIAHALGININSNEYMSHIETQVGTMFFDMNDNGNYDDNDWRVYGTHEEDHAFSPNDLMYIAEVGGYPRNRLEPTLQHAQILGKTFDYCVVPEPATILLLGSSLIGLARLRKGGTRGKGHRGVTS